MKTTYEVIDISYTDTARSCVACGNLFTQEDDVVFCPVCGAPHHRSCWLEEGHCHYEAAHGTDLQWQPKTQEPEETTPPKEELEKENEPAFNGLPNGVIVVKCPHCGKFVPGQTTPSTCRNCGMELPAVPAPFDATFGNEPAPDANTPIDTATVGKLSRIVMQRRNYYIPRFMALKNQGTKILSWNWSAFFFTTYWFAYRKCHVWAIFSSLIELIALLFMSPFSNQTAAVLSGQQFSSYMEAFHYLMANMNLESGVLLLSQVALLILLVRAILFGLLGNFIYKKECLKRAKQLDEMPKEEAAHRVFKLSGVSVFAPILFYYLIGFLETIVTSFI